MHGLEQHACASCGRTMDGDRTFAENARRLLLKVVAMIEDRYGLRPVNQDRKGERAPTSTR